MTEGKGSIAGEGPRDTAARGNPGGISPRDRLFEATVVDGGALGAAAIDTASRVVVAGHAHDGLASAALLDLLLGPARPSGALTLGCGGPPPAPARELLIAGRDRAVYCQRIGRELIVLAAPVEMSVALAWALVRALAAGEPAP